MKNSRERIPSVIILIISLCSAFVHLNDTYCPASSINAVAQKSPFLRVKSTSSPKAPMEMKKGRSEYFFRMLRDPAANRIPRAIRQRELQFAKNLQSNASRIQKPAISYTWKEGGPNDVGGRTRALAVDIENSAVILAGGVSGGIWKSTDNGQSWKIKNTTTQILSVTSIAQDRRPGFRNNWYYVCGEFNGGSAMDMGGNAFFTGDGVYRSTDNGETWNVLPGTASNNFTKWDSYFDYCQKIIVTAKGNIFISTCGAGILRSTDGGNTFHFSLGGTNQHVYSDIDESSDGKLIAVVSSAFEGVTQDKEPGIYKSLDEGVTWIKITPAAFPHQHARSKIASAPSNPKVAYVLTDIGIPKNNRDDIRFYKLDIDDVTSEDRSANMPDFGNNREDFIHTQDSYNMTLAVKPDDENFVIIGATSLFRSTDGFSTKPSDSKLCWIGGYDMQNFIYPNLHPDIHSFAFDPFDPRKMWCGHDGGLSYTTDITNTNYEQYFPWENKNNGYNVTQFYMVTISDEANDYRIMGGTQDNGTPLFKCDGILISKSVDASSGDGSYAYFGNQFAFTSSQFGYVNRFRYDQNGELDPGSYSIISPKNARNQLFINPFVIDPINENIMYYPSGNVIWRNSQINSIPDGQQGTTLGWNKIAGISVPLGYVISALNVSKNNPAGILYYGISSYTSAPGLYKISNAQNSASGITEISIPEAAEGAYVHNIAVNPDNGNEILVVLSNYNITGLFHSSDGGKNYTAVEGNLEGSASNPGPSLRCVSILPSSNGKLYIVATSIGLFSTTSLNGNSTKWHQEGANEIGNSVVDYVISRKSDGRIVAGTHGRGVFIGTAGNTGTKALASVNVSSIKLQAEPGSADSASFLLENKGNADLNFDINTIVNSLSYQTNKSHSSLNAEGSYTLFIDDGNDHPDTFIGFGSQSEFPCANEFNITGFDFRLEAIHVFMRSENSQTNAAEYAVMDENFNKISGGFKDFELSEKGSWFVLHLDSAIIFRNGHSFFLKINITSKTGYPAGWDWNAAVKGKSYYLDNNNNPVNMSTIQGAENGAFLIRASGSILNEGKEVVLSP
ncbi:MAG: WD40/YVTN/BNR-like repeat-containing protein, partial [Bacillota bacterium]